MLRNALRNALGILLALVAVPSLLFAQDATMRHRDSTRIDTTRIGIMSPMVVQQRLRTLGYSQVSVVENVRAYVRVNALKGGRPVAATYDPHTGKAIDAPGRYVLRRVGVRLLRPDGSEVIPRR